MPPDPPPKSLAAQVAGAGAWGFGGRAVLLFANLLATPFLIRLLGPSSYGVWTLLIAAITWTQVSDAGMAAASTKFGADCYARGDAKGEATVVWTALGLLGVTTGCVAIAVGLGAHWISDHLLHHERGLVGAGAAAFRIACVIVILQCVVGVMNTPLLVRLKWRQWTTVTTAANLFGIAGAPIALAVFKTGVVTAALVMLLASMLLLLGSVPLALHFQPALRHPRFDKAVLLRLLRYGGPLSLAGLAVIPLTTAERFLLALNHSTSAVAYYAVAANVATVLLVFPEQLVAPLVPAMARLEAVGRLGELHALYRKSLARLCLVVTPSAIVLGLVARPFLSLWAGPQYGARSTAPFLILLVGAWLNCLAWVPNSYLLSSGRTTLMAWVKMAELPPFLAAAWILTKHSGPMGAAVAWSGRCAVDSVVLFAVVRVPGRARLTVRPDARKASANST